MSSHWSYFYLARMDVAYGRVEVAEVRSAVMVAVAAAVVVPSSAGPPHP